MRRHVAGSSSGSSRHRPTPTDDGDRGKAEHRPRQPEPGDLRYGATPGPRIVPSPNAEVSAASAPVRSTAASAPRHRPAPPGSTPSRTARRGCAAPRTARTSRSAEQPGSPRRSRGAAEHRDAEARDTDLHQPLAPLHVRRARPKRRRHVHSSAENEKITATRVGRMPIARAIDGSTDCSAVLPAATRAARRTARRSRGGERGGAGGGPSARGVTPPRGFAKAAVWPALATPPRFLLRRRSLALPGPPLCCILA